MAAHRTAWTLTKDHRTLRCDVLVHGRALELVLYEDGALRHTQVVADEQDADIQAQILRLAAEGRGWK